jgi:hypothetical protein
VSREGALCRARERAQAVEDALGRGVTLELLGVPIVVLYAEERRTVVAGPGSSPFTTVPTRSGRRPA